MRRSFPVLVLLLAGTASCGGNIPSRPPEQPASQSAPPALPQTQYESNADGRASRDAGPNVGPTAAPGVAFNYRYAFRLAAPRIAEVQEQHARMCEQLTVQRCRITGMLYRVVNERDIEAMLAFRLDPAAARAFGRDATGSVVQAEGMLTESEITGTDAGTTIRQAGRSIAELEAEIARIEARLRAGAPAAERERLEYDAQQFRAQIAALRENREQQQDSLATTPMVFRYGSGDRVPGFAPRPTLKQSMERAWENFQDGGILLLIVLITLLPWAVALAIVAIIVAFIRRKLARRAERAAAEAPVTP